MWKYILNKISTECDKCRHGCRLDYIETLRLRGYTEVSCRYSPPYSELHKSISDNIREGMVNVMVTSLDVCSKGWRLDQIPPDVILGWVYLPGNDSRTEMVMVC